MDYNDKLLKRLAHAVADYKQAAAGVRAKEFSAYLYGMRDAVTALGGEADFTINMHVAYTKVGARPPCGSVDGKIMKAWEALMIEQFRKEMK